MALTLPSTLFLVVYGAFLAERMLELVIHRRNAKHLAARGAVWHGADGFLAIFLGQFALLALLPLEVAAAPWALTGGWTWALLAGVVLTQFLRYWVILTLGRRWTIRVVTLPGAPRIASGPYRWVRHPNYVAVAIEAIILPLAFGAWVTVAVALPLTLYALRSRIRHEERALAAAENIASPT